MSPDAAASADKHSCYEDPLEEAVVHRGVGLGEVAEDVDC